MNNDFDRGFLLGLAVVYKRAAEAIGFGGFVILSRADGVVQADHMSIVQEVIDMGALQPEDMRPTTVDSVDLAPAPTTDAVQAII